MPILQVRDVPEELYDTLSKVAKQDNRSISQETIVLLKQALKLKQERISKRQSVLEEIEAFNKDKDKVDLPDPVVLIREDRNR